MSGNCAAMRRTYSRAPPFTVIHCGRSLTCSKPWLWQNCRKVATGYSSIVRGGHDQIAAAIGTKYQSRNSAPYRLRSR